MDKIAIDEGTRAIIELTAKRAAAEAVEAHATKTCPAPASVERLWVSHGRLTGRVRRLELILVAAAASGGAGIGAWKALEIFFH